MATASINPRYIFTQDRVPAVIVFSIATGIASLAGLLAYGFFEQAGWLFSVKKHAGGIALVFDSVVFAIKLLLVSAAVIGIELFAKRTLLKSFEPAIASRRVNDMTFGITMGLAFFLGFIWNTWIDFNGIAGATFFVVLAAIALTLLDIPFRKFSSKLIFLGIIFALFMSVLYAEGSETFSSSWFPSVLGLLTVALPTSLVAWFAPYENQQSKFGSLIMILIALFVFVGGTLWVVLFSFTSMKVLPLFTPAEWVEKFNGFANYTRLFNTSRWMDCPALSKIGTDAWAWKCAGSFPNVVT